MTCFFSFSPGQSTVPLPLPPGLPDFETSPPCALQLFEARTQALPFLSFACCRPEPGVRGKLCCERAEGVGVGRWGRGTWMGGASSVHGMSTKNKNPGGIGTRRYGNQEGPSGQSRAAGFATLWPLIGWLSLGLRDRTGLFSGGCPYPQYF